MIILKELYNHQWFIDLLFDYCKLSEYYNLIQINSNFRIFFENLDQYLWFKIAKNEYSLFFWEQAQLRNPIISKPLNNYKLELLRLKNFEHCLLRHNLNKFELDDYINLWQILIII